MNWEIPLSMMAATRIVEVSSSQFKGNGPILRFPKITYCTKYISSVLSEMNLITITTVQRNFLRHDLN